MHLCRSTNHTVHNGLNTLSPLHAPLHTVCLMDNMSACMYAVEILFCSMCRGTKSCLVVYVYVCSQAALAPLEKRVPSGADHWSNDSLAHYESALLQVQECLALPDQ